MKAIHFEQYGPPEVLRVVEVDQPTLKAGEVLVKVHAAGLNRADLVQRQGKYPPPQGGSPILGLEISGEVASPSTHFQVGDRVMAVITGGGYAEYVAVPESMLMPIPAHLDDIQASAIPEAFLTAYLNLFALGNLQQEERVLIHAGASGIGTAAIQLARQAGATIFITAGSQEKVDFCLTLGAHHGICYREQSFKEVIAEITEQQGVNLIIDFVGAPYWNDNLDSLAHGGRLILVGSLGGTVGTLDLAKILPKNLMIRGTTLRRTPLDQKAQWVKDFLDRFGDDLEAGKISPIIDSVYPFEEAAKAHVYLHSNTSKGKVILSLK